MPHDSVAHDRRKSVVTADGETLRTVEDIEETLHTELDSIADTERTP